MKAPTMFISSIGTQAPPSRRNSRWSSSRTKALRRSCRYSDCWRREPGEREAEVIDDDRRSRNQRLELELSRLRAAASTTQYSYILKPPTGRRAGRTFRAATD